VTMRSKEHTHRRFVDIVHVPAALIRETVAHLETLVGLLKDISDVSQIEKFGLTPEARARKEVGLSIKVLLLNNRVYWFGPSLNGRYAFNQIVDCSRSLR